MNLMLFEVNTLLTILASILVINLTFIAVVWRIYKDKIQLIYTQKPTLEALDLSYQQKDHTPSEGKQVPAFVRLGFILFMCFTMPINPLKEFFKRKKAEVKFARAGPGQTLSSNTAGPTPGSSSTDQSARQAAAEAAMKRFNKDNAAKPAQRPRITQSQDISNKTVNTTKQEDSATESQQRVVQKELPVIDGEPQRNVQVYSTDELAQRIKQPEIDDNFFRLTIEDAKLFQQRYDEEKARNEILKTSEMRRREAEAKKPSTNIARLRFKLPNNLILEASFSGDETMSLIRDWLVAMCIDKTGLELKNFDILFGLRPMKDGDLEMTVRTLGLIPATTLTVVQK